MQLNTDTKYEKNGEINKCFISGTILHIREDRLSIKIQRTGSDEEIICSYKKGKNKLPLHFNIGDYVVFNGKISQSIIINSPKHHVFQVFSAFKQDSNNESNNKNSCLITGTIISYKKIDLELVEAELLHANKIIKLYFKRNYRYMLYDFENKYKDLSVTKVILHGYFKRDGIWVDRINEISKRTVF